MRVYIHTSRVDYVVRDVGVEMKVGWSGILMQLLNRFLCG